MNIVIHKATLDTLEESGSVEIEDDPYEYDDDFTHEAKAEESIYQNDEQVLMEG